MDWEVSYTHHHVNGDHAALGIDVQHASCQGPAVTWRASAHEALVLGPLEKAGGQAPMLLILAPCKHLQQRQEPQTTLQGLLISSYPQSLYDGSLLTRAISSGLAVRRPCIQFLELIQQLLRGQWVMQTLLT